MQRQDCSAIISSGKRNNIRPAKFWWFCIYCDVSAAFHLSLVVLSTQVPRQSHGDPAGKGLLGAGSDCTQYGAHNAELSGVHPEIKTQ